MEVRNVRYNNRNTIDCEINHPEFGWIPFTADPDDPVELGQEIYTQAMAGAFGLIGPPDEPVTPEIPVEELIDSEMTRQMEDVWLALKELGADIPVERQAELDRKAAWRAQLTTKE